MLRNWGKVVLLRKVAVQAKTDDEYFQTLHGRSTFPAWCADTGLLLVVRTP